MPDKHYDVFLSHNSDDKPTVERLAHKLRAAGFEPFLDKWHLVPGEPWMEAIEDALDQSNTCAVLLGPGGLGPWENEEMRAAIDRRVKERKGEFRVIPVLLPHAQMPELGRLPWFLSRLTWVDFRQDIDDIDAFYRLTCGVKGMPPGPSEKAQLVAEQICPYRGLQSFEEQDAGFFFGREALTQWLVEGLRSGRFLAVIGPSGSGKSSVVRAGLIPALRRGALRGSGKWPILLMTPGTRPLEGLAAHLSHLPNGGGDRVTRMLQLQDRLHADHRALHAAVCLALADNLFDSHVLLIVDQFEELFTLCQDEDERQRFLDNLLYASSIAQGRTLVVLALRADFYSKAAVYSELADRVSGHQVLVTPMQESELRDAIELPAQRVGLTFDGGLVDTILDDVRGAPGALPLMQHALLELWERRQNHGLTLAAYREIGGVDGAVAQRAEAEYGALPLEHQGVARRILLRLVQPGEGTEDTRRRAYLGELLSSPERTPMVEAVLQRLAMGRLVTTSREAATGKQVVDVAHEALIRGWPRLRGWIEEDRAALRIHWRLAQTAMEWREKEHDESYLYRGTLLSQAEEWAKIHASDLNLLERDFLDASRALEQHFEHLKQQIQSDRMAAAIGQLTANLAHHIKNLTGLIRISAMRLLDTEPTLSDSQMKATNRILQNAVAIMRFLDDLFTPFRQVEPELVDVGTLVQEALTSIGSRDDVKITMILASDLPNVLVGPQEMISVLEEMTINALKAAEKSTVQKWTEFRTKLAPDGFVEVHISNSGPSIPRDQWDVIFEPFRRGPSEDESSGSGLGLWAARLIVEKHGGEVHLIDSDNTRTIFVVRLPPASG